jgi:hypothetical protein
MNKEVEEGYRNRLKNKLFGLLCEFEKKGEWESFLDAIIIELSGVPEEQKTINYITLCNKINSLRYLSYEYFRKTIFDCMSLLSKGGFNEVL